MPVLATSAAGTAVILSANPIHDTGGGQRSAQLALELLDRDFDVLFVSHGKVTETVDLGMKFDHPRLINASLASIAEPGVGAILESFLSHAQALVITQVPVRSWEPVLARARSAGAVTVYDCIDRWDSELGRGWYQPESERRIAEASDVLVASAAELVHHLELLAERETSLLPNAYNSRVFRTGSDPERPADLPRAPRLALYVGALWGGWLDWDLVAGAARALPETAFVFVGDHRREGRGLPDNCVFLGLKPHQALPGYLAHADVAFLPWKADEITQATSPLKVYEFVAMGLPVVGPAIGTLQGIPGVWRFTDPSDFTEAIRDTGRDGLPPEVTREMAAFADRNSWVQRLDAMLGLAHEVVATRGRGGTSGPSVRAKRAMVSVVIPAYNHERWVGKAIESVTGQSMPAGELVVVDDGSSDGTPGVLDDSRFPGMRVIRQENRGAHVAINRGVALSKGDYVAILNSDDEFTSERLEHSWGVARASGAALVIGSVHLIDASGDPLAEDHDSSRWYREARAEPSRSGSLAKALLRHNFAVTTSNFFFHRELWRRLRGFGAYRYVHDYDFVLRALELCPDRVVYAEALEGVRYRVHGDNTILEDIGRATAERAALLKRIRSPWRRWRAFLERPRVAAAVARAVAATDDPTPDAGETRVVSAPIRLGLVTPSLDQGGLEEVVALLAQTLPHHGIEPHVLCTHAGGSVAARLSAADVDVRVARGGLEDWRRWAGEASPHALSTHFVDVEVVEGLATTGIPIYETVHNTYAWFTEADWAREASKGTHLTGTVAVSDLVALYYARFTGTEPTRHVIPNGVHPARAAAVPRMWARERLGIPPSAPVVAHLGRVTLQKNILGLIDAFRTVLEAEPTARLILAGSLNDGAYLRSVRRRHRALFQNGAVRLLPPVPHVGAILCAADVYVSNSFFEGWSLAASEAVWNGLPLVLSDCGSARQLVGEQGERGRVVSNPLGDPLDVTWERLKTPPSSVLEANQRQLAAVLLDVLGSSSTWSARRADIRRHARSELAPRRVSRAYAELFRAALAS